MSNGWYHMISPFIHHNSPLLGQTTPPGDGNSAASPPRRLAKMGDPGQSDITRTNIPWDRKNIHNQIIIIHKWFINVFENSSQQCEDGSEFKTGNHKRWSSIHFWVLQFAMWVVCNEVLVTQKELVIGCSSPKLWYITMCRGQNIQVLFATFVMFCKHRVFIEVIIIPEKLPSLTFSNWTALGKGRGPRAWRT